MFCTGCGFKMEHDARFCVSCGAAQAVPLEPVNPNYPPAPPQKEVKIWKSIVAIVAIFVLLLSGAIVGILFAFNLVPFGDESYEPYESYESYEPCESYEPESKVIEEIVLPAHDPEPIPWGNLLNFYFSWFKFGDDGFNHEAWSFTIAKRDNSYFLNVFSFPNDISNQQISASDVDGIRKILEENNVIRWNDFYRPREKEYILIGRFQLSIYTENGITVSAFGEDEFPENYDIIAPMLKEYLIDLARQFLPEPEPEPERIVEPLDPDFDLSTLPTSDDIWGKGALHPEAILYRLEIVYDLTELNLINFTLSQESFFEIAEIKSYSGHTYNVLSTGECITPRIGVVTSDALNIVFNVWDIEYPYFSDAVEVLEVLLLRILYRAELPTIPAGALRTNADRSIAVLPLRNFAPFEGEVILNFLSAQVIPENDEIVLFNFWTWTIVTDHFSPNVLAALEELCELIGFDFIKYYDGIQIIDRNWAYNIQLS